MNLGDDIVILETTSTEVKNRILKSHELLRAIDTGALYIGGKDGKPQALISSSTSSDGVNVFSVGDLSWPQYSGGVARKSEAASAPLRAAIAKAMAGISDVRIWAAGDSFSYGTGITNGDYHYATALARNLSAETGIPVGLGFIPLSLSPGCGTNVGRGLVALGAGWSESATYIYTYNVNPMKPSAAGITTSIDVSIPETCDSVRLLWYNSGNCMYSWNADGIGAATVLTNPGGVGPWVTSSIPAPSRGSGHVLHLWAPASGAVPYLAAVEPQDSQIKKIRPFSSGKSGVCASQLATYYSNNTYKGFQALAAAGVDLHITQVGTNDRGRQAGYSDGDTWAGYLSTIMSKVRLSGRSMTLAHLSQGDFSGSPSAPSAGDYLRLALSVCATIDALCASWWLRDGTYASGSALGLYSDTVHANHAGSASIGKALHLTL